jgi:DNA modification methylase
MRDYQTRQWIGGDPSCEHDQSIGHGPHHPGQVEQTKWKKADAAGKGQTSVTYSCSKCGSWYGQLGLEPTPELYVEHMTEVFREVKRTLRDDGVLWLNIGDSFASSSTYRAPRSMHTDAGWKQAGESHATPNRGLKHPSIKAKDLVGIPWMLAFALRADGWYLRMDVIWAKPNCLPESVLDRPTRSHEYVFLLSKSSDYFYDVDAIREPFIGQNEHDRTGGSYAPPGQSEHTGSRAGLAYNPAGRNKRSVWSISTKPYKGAHFAVMPPELAETCIKAGSSEHGACGKCGAPYQRIVERAKVERSGEVKRNERDGGLTAEHGFERSGMSHFKYNEWLQENPPITLGWEPSCKCGVAEIKPCIILDPFSGSGTTLAAAKQLRRDYLGVEINEEYRTLIEERINVATKDASLRSAFEDAMNLPE